MEETKLLDKWLTYIMIRHSDSSCSPDRSHRGGSTSSVCAAWSPWPVCRRHPLLPVNRQQCLYWSATVYSQLWEYILPWQPFQISLIKKSLWPNRSQRWVCGRLSHLTGSMLNVWLWMWWDNRRGWVRDGGIGATAAAHGDLSDTEALFSSQGNLAMSHCMQQCSQIHTYHLRSIHCAKHWNNNTHTNAITVWCVYFWCFHGLTLSAWVFPWYSSFFPQPKNLHIRWTGNCKLSHCKYKCMSPVMDCPAQDVFLPHA